MTILAYSDPVPLTSAEASLDFRFGTAITLKDTDPARSQAILLELASGGMVSAHLELYSRYKYGIVVDRNCELALSHLLQAVEFGAASGSCEHASPMSKLMAGTAMNSLGMEYGRDQRREFDELDPILVEHDRSKAAQWHRKAAEICPHAKTRLPDNLRAFRSARDCSVDELAEIERLYAAMQDFYTIGTMYCVDKLDPVATPEDIARARQWYLEGSESGCNHCIQALRNWGELSPKTETVKRVTTFHVVPEESSRKVSELTGWLLAPIPIILWAIVGTVLLGVFTFVSSLTLPVILAVALVSFIYRIIKR